MIDKRVTILVPATAANLGPAFDCIGMALDLWNEISVGLDRNNRVSVSVTGEGRTELSNNSCNLVYMSMSHLFKKMDKTVGPLDVRCHNRIPIARGLGSSASAIVGGLMGANHLLGQPLQNHEILDMAIQLEGHPDNVTACLLGGTRIVVPNMGKVITALVKTPPDLKTVLYMPDHVIPTSKARSVLPADASYENAIFNMGRVALLINALSSDKLEDLEIATQDCLHQPYREKLFPAMRYIMKEAIRAGALGAFLSGSGSTVLAFARGREMSIAYEMAEAARKTNTPGRVIITSPSEKGAYVSNHPLNK